MHKIFKKTLKSKGGVGLIESVNLVDQHVNKQSKQLPWNRCVEWHIEMALQS